MPHNDKEFNLFTTAFILKNNLITSDAEIRKETEKNRKENQRIRDLMDAIEKKEIRKAIEK